MQGCPSRAGSEDNRRRFANSLRVGASPAVAYAINRAWYETDLREVLPAVRVPTLLLYRSVSLDNTMDQAMDIASRIPNARVMRVSGNDYFGFELSHSTSPTIASGSSRAKKLRPSRNRLATVMFTAIVGQPAMPRGSAIAPSRPLARRDAVVRETSRYRGTNATLPATGSSRHSMVQHARSAQRGDHHRTVHSASKRIGIHVGDPNSTTTRSRVAQHRSRVASSAGAGEVLVSQTSETSSPVRNHILGSRHPRTQRNTAVAGKYSQMAGADN